MIADSGNDVLVSPALWELAIKIVWASICSIELLGVFIEQNHQDQFKVLQIT